MKDDSAETGIVDSPTTPLRRASLGAVLIGRYRLDAQLGRGGMGVVYRATDEQLKRQVAVKVLPESVAAGEARIQLLREARAAAALNHPHIVAVHDVGEDHHVPFFVMEFVQGVSLPHAVIRDPAEIVALALQVCSALEHAHAHGLVHRDVKPENILLTSEGPDRRVKLADLGLAVSSGRSQTEELGKIVGTAYYMAPEQALGEPVDGRTDLYSLGAVLYELATGRPPFEGDHALGVISQHVNAPVVPPRTFRSDLPRGLEAVILRLLAKRADQRYASASETAHALRACLEDDDTAPVAATPSVVLLDALSRGRLVGRADELTEALEWWSRARQGLGHGLLFSGEPGVGKTRLARELMIQASVDGAVVLSGACYEFEAATPHMPFAEALQRWVRAQTDDVALREAVGDRGRQIARLAPELDGRLGPFTSAGDMPAHEERLLFVDTIAGLFRSLAAPRGLLFYVDDLHWADSGTLWLLGHLLRRLADARVLVVASYRESELDRAHPLSKALVEWNRERLTTRIALKRLSPADTHAQLSALLGQEVGGGLAEALHRETEGNPFFIEEMLKALIEQGAVHRHDGRWSHCAVSNLHLPQSVKAAIGRRLNRVSDSTNDVLRAAAVLGKTFDFDELLEATGNLDEEGLLNALDGAVAAQLLVAGRHETFAFTHDKIREVLYEELNPIRRRRLHKRTAEGLERIGQRRPVRNERLAHHYIEAGVHDRGLRYARDAAGDAQRMFAYDEALSAYGRALECAEALGLSEERLALEEQMGQSCLIAGNTIASLEHFERALALASDPLVRARLLCGAANSLVTNGDQRGLAYVREARTVLDPIRQPIETGNALLAEGRFHHLAGHHRQSIALFEQAVRLLVPQVDVVPHAPAAATSLVLAYCYLAGAHQHLGMLDDADGWARRALDFGIRHQRPAAEALGYEFLAEQAQLAGRWMETLDYVTRERAIADRIRSRERRAWTHMPTGLALVSLGDAVRAEAEFIEGLEIANEIGERRLATLLLISRSAPVADLGRLDEALRLALDALDSAEKLGLLFMQTEARRGLAYVYYKAGQFERAILLFDDVLRMTEGREPKVSRLLMGLWHVRTLVAAGQSDAAFTQFNAFASLAAQCQSPRAVKDVDELRMLLGITP